MGSGDGDCTHYLIPHDVLQSWRENRALGAIDRPEDKNLARRAIGLEEMSKRVRDVGGEEGEDAWTLNERMIRRLGEFLNYKKLRENKYTNPPNRPSPSQPPVHPSSASPPRSYSDEKILETVPRSYRERARRLLERWTADSAVKYDRDTGVVTVGGRELRGSNVADLLKDAVSRGVKRPRPTGFESLKEHAYRSSIPPTMFTNPAWRNVRSDSGNSDSSDSSDATIKPPSPFRASTSSDEETSDVVDMGELWQTIK